MSHKPIIGWVSTVLLCKLFYSWDDETRTTLSFDEKYTHDSKGQIWSQMKAYDLFYRFPVVVGSKKCSVML